MSINILRCRLPESLIEDRFAESQESPWFAKKTQANMIRDAEFETSCVSIVETKDQLKIPVGGSKFTALSHGMVV